MLRMRYVMEEVERLLSLEPCGGFADVKPSIPFDEEPEEFGEKVPIDWDNNPICF